MISKSLDLYLSQYDNIVIVGDLNTEVGEIYINVCCERYSLSSPIKEPTIYKSPENQSVQKSSVVETGLPDFLRMIVTVSKTTFQRLPPKIRNCRYYSIFDNGMSRACLFNDL